MQGPEFVERSAGITHHQFCAACLLPAVLCPSPPAPPGPVVLKQLVLQVRLPRMEAHLPSRETTLLQSHVFGIFVGCKKKDISVIQKVYLFHHSKCSHHLWNQVSCFSVELMYSKQPQNLVWHLQWKESNIWYPRSLLSHRGIV